MSFFNRVNRPVYWALGAGVAMGAFAVASVMSGHGVTPAVAQVAHLKPAANLSVDESFATLRAMDNAFASLAESVEPSVVNIRAEGKTENAIGQNVRMGGEGSGVVYRSDGWIMTNDHVAGGFDKVTVVLDDGREFPGKVVRAPESDIAMVKIEATDLPAARFADSGAVRTGQFAIAFGSPFGLEKSMTVGHVSALSRQSLIPDERTGAIRNYGDLIQTDAAINQGNSGGPLVNIDGNVVGINTAIYSETGGSVGIGFAIPANQAKLIGDMLIEKGKVVRGYLGVLPEDLKGYQVKELGVQAGAVATQVPNDGPASAAGMKENDVIVRVGTYPIANQGDVRNAMLRYGPGETVPVQVVRDGTEKTLQVKLGEPPAPPTMNVPAPQRGSRGNPFPNLPPEFKDFQKFFERPNRGQAPPEGDVSPLREGKAKLGVTVRDLSDEMRKQYDITAKVSGAVVVGVEPGSVAERMGIEEGDVIERLGDTDIKSAADVASAMSGVEWGQSRTIRVGRYQGNSTMIKTMDVTFR
ncbi:MAG: trypsin-like peptidase domain-containing protein [Fimbriimonadaceae bacterium]|nr:trypsin-like peptidase domain-containing protein [Fimbriimonadaceae bacterium]